MRQQTAGIHHITAFVSNAQKNVDFYAGVLGLRLVKKTINFDAPDVYHLYFGNEQGSPGTVITFFPFPMGRKGAIGGGQVGWTTYAVPVGSLEFWKERLNKFGISFTMVERFSESYVQFRDADGLQLELVEREEGPASQWSFGGVPPEKAIKGFGGALLYSTDPESTMKTLENTLGLTKVGEDKGAVRFRSTGNLGNLIDVSKTQVAPGRNGTGIVHHIAWRAADEADHLRFSTAVKADGFELTPVKDRNYFKALYFREHGGILFEIATDPPGFTVDEPEAELGQNLMLPEWFENKRPALEQNLIPIVVRVLDQDLM